MQIQTFILKKIILAAITEVLTPAQREKLAAKIEKGPEHKGPPPGAR